MRRTDFDPHKGFFTFATGKKGSGKSYLSRRIFDSYPFDRLVIDVTGDVRKDLTADGVDFVDLDKDVLPLRFPSDLQGKRVTAVYVPDMGGKESLLDADRAIGLGYAHGRCLVWLDEIGILAPANAAPPNMKRILHHGRHRQLSVLMAGPRPKTVDPLTIAQADHVFMFNTPNPGDRKRIAEEIGWPPRLLDEAHARLGKHEYLWYNHLANGGLGQMSHMDPLPPRARLPYDQAEGV